MFSVMKHGATSIAVTLTLAMCLQNVSAQAPLDSLKSDFEEEVGESITEFEEYSRQALEEYNEYSRQAAEDYAAYVQSIKTAWGGVFIDDTPTEWVEYGENLLSRSIVDFDSGNITVEVIIPDDGTPEETLLADAVERLLNSRGSTCPYPSTVDVSEPLTASPILDGIVDFSGYDIDTSGIYSADMRKPAPKAPPAPTVKGKTIPQEKSQRPERPASVSDKKTGADRQTMASRILEEERKAAEEKAAIAKAVAEQSVKTYETYGEGSETKKVVRINLSLVTDNLSKNAALYKDIITEFSQKFQIEQALIYAVMEQESRFNPEATSWVPAYGLMQLVPTSGGFDAYRYVYGKEWVPTRSYLFNPRNNIELGTAYLRILENQFSNIDDPHCRRLCVIAGYNTGAGNVSRAFTGNTNLRKALPLINDYGYRQLYDHLTTKLSTEEARNYVSGVTQRREKYLK